jgi:hypothetical protein
MFQLDPKLNNNGVDGKTQNAYAKNDGLFLTCADNEAIVITDLMSRRTGQLREDTALGDVIITITESGISNFTTPIMVSAGSAIYNWTSDDPSLIQNQVSINYYKVRV